MNFAEEEMQGYIWIWLSILIQFSFIVNFN